MNIQYFLSVDKISTYLIVMIRLEPVMWPLLTIFMLAVFFIHFIAVGTVRHKNAVKIGTFSRWQNFKQTYFKRRPFFPPLLRGGGGGEATDAIHFKRI